MPPGYLPLLLFSAAALVFPVALLVLGKLIRPSAPSRVKGEAYECGVPPESSARGRYSVQFYLVAILFVLFDAETVMLFPWAVRYHQLGLFGVVEAGVFLAFLIVGYVWAWRNGALEWV